MASTEQPATKQHSPFISPQQSPAEFTLKAALLGILLACVLAISNTFLALKVGVLTASSIPAAMLSMSVLKLFRRHTILENNMVQTCASAGEAIAGGIVYTAPALIFIHAWQHFPYWQTWLLTFTGGGLGVLFTIPVRRLLMQNRDLRFPEAQAISQVLIAGSKKAIGIGHLIFSAALGALFEIAQTAFKLLAYSTSLWISKGQTVLGFGIGFSATLLGAGYLTGFAVGSSILTGAVLAHMIILPTVSHFQAANHAHIIHNTKQYAENILGHRVRYVGIGAMLAAGFFTLLKMVKPFYKSLVDSMHARVKISPTKNNKFTSIRTDIDIPVFYILIGCILLSAISYFLFYHIIDLNLSVFSGNEIHSLILAAAILIFIIIVGFLFSVICAYFSGLVGVTASPGSAIAIATVLFAAILVGFFGHFLQHFSPDITKLMMMLTIMLTCVVMGSACVANNNSQDLKVGYIIGATPWKQQLMLLLGVAVASFVVPYVMQLLYNAYGLVGVGEGAKAGIALAAPPAAAMAAIAAGAFSHQLPTMDLWYGAFIMIGMALLKKLLSKNKLITIDKNVIQMMESLSLIGVAIGMYLPLSSSTPLFIGGLVQYFAQRTQQKRAINSQQVTSGHKGLLVACGLVAGAAIMNVFLAIPFALFSGETLALISPAHHMLTTLLAIIAIFSLGFYLYYQASSKEK